jgi:PqqD family protein of HPr-rel-A system
LTPSAAEPGAAAAGFAPGTTTGRFTAAPDIELRQWPGETAAVVYQPRAGTTHLISAEALAVLECVAGHAEGLELREIEHAAGFDGEVEPEVRDGLQGIITGLLNSGLLRRRSDDGETGGPGGR